MPLRVGILSAAHMHVWSYVSALKAHPGAEIVGVWDDDEGRGAKFSGATGLAVADDLDKLIAEVDVVIITSENTKHVMLAEKAAEKGKHILCEKPLVTTRPKPLR